MLSGRRVEMGLGEAVRIGVSEVERKGAMCEERCLPTVLKKWVKKRYTGNQG
jgi:hypothetical protein